MTFIFSSVGRISDNSMQHMQPPPPPTPVIEYDKSIISDRMSLQSSYPVARIHSTLDLRGSLSLDRLQTELVHTKGQSLILFKLDRKFQTLENEYCRQATDVPSFIWCLLKWQYVLTHAAPSVFKWNTYIIIHVARMRMIHMHAFSAIAIVACYWDKINNINLCVQR